MLSAVREGKPALPPLLQSSAPVIKIVPRGPAVQVRSESPKLRWVVFY